MKDLLQSNDEATRESRDTTLQAFLADPKSYPHQPEVVTLVQTHASYVAIAPPYVFKVKKEVDLGFLDFSTLEKRKHFCDEEVRLNTRLCSRIYEGVVPIFERGGTFSFDDDGIRVPAEYAVKMHQLPSGGFLDRRLDSSSGRVNTATIDRIVNALVPFYRSQESTPEISEWGTIDKLSVSTDENFEQTKGFCGHGLPQATFDVTSWYTDNFFDQNADLFDRRVSGGRILDCHGDLHAEHIHLSDEGVCIYDCIEFNKRFRSIDVASDTAFLSMDLRRHGRPHLATAFARRISEELEDKDLLKLLPFYACYRAYVRGKVELFKSAATEVPAEERDKSLDRASQYFQLALDYAVTGGRPVVVICMGRVGTGKSTTAARLRTVLGWDTVSSDYVRKKGGGVPLFERASRTRPGLYASAVTESVYGELTKRALQNAEAGRSTVLDATFSQRSHRDTLRRELGWAGVPFAFIEMTAEKESVVDRLKAREQSADVLSDARLEDMEMMNNRFEEFGESEGAPIRIRAEGEVDGSVAALLKRLHAALEAD